MSKTIDLNKPIMPKATAVWLIDNTMLTFQQIADFTELHVIEIEGLANGDVGKGINGRSPIDEGLLTDEEIKRVEKDPDAQLKSLKSNLPPIKTRSKGPRYTPVSKRGDKPDAIAFIIKHHPEITDAQICKLVGTTKPTIKAIRERTHANIANIKPRNPADLGICTYRELEAASEKGLRAQGKDPEVEKAKKAAALKEETENETSEGEDSSSSGGFDFTNFLKQNG